VRIFGEPAGAKHVLRRMGFQSEIFHTYGFKSAESLLRFYGELGEMTPQRLDEAVPRQLARLGLAAASKRKAGTFSKGMVQRLGLAQALLHAPELLVLDEPTTGLDPEGRKLVADIILEEKARGTTVFLSSHILSDVERTCDHVIMLREGNVVVSESMTNLRGDSDEWEIEVINGASVRCRASEKRDVLLRLLQSGAEIGEVRARGRSLEELYMQHVGGSSSG
jgi:ABC-2 type transport system ATP-binding protein